MWKNLSGQHLGPTSALQELDPIPQVKATAKFCERLLVELGGTLVRPADRQADSPRLSYVEGVTHDYVRHSTTTLFAALNSLASLAPLSIKAQRKVVLDGFRIILRKDPLLANLPVEVRGVQSKQISVEASRIINAPVDRVWAEVANFKNVAAWHPDVVESRMQDANSTGCKPGEVRIIKLRNDTVIRERLVAIDPGAHRYEYSVLDGQLPLKNHISSLSMRTLDDGRTEVIWKASFEPAGAPVDALVEGVRSSVLELGLQGLEERAGEAA